ncbi:unnamed protein product, partial [Didymodactylos carnosus]
EIADVYVTLITLLNESARLSPVLLDDFRLAHCYVHMKDLILRLENEWMDDESEKLFSNFITLIGDLCYAGFTDIKLPQKPETIIDIPSFVMPQPKKFGFIVKNLHAFNLLQAVFQQTTHPYLIHIVFDTINSVLLADNANYFITGENLSPLTEVISNKPNEIQIKVYDLLEFVVFQLKYIPFKELVNLSILLKANHSVQSNIHCVKYLVHILKFNSILKDALRELGFIEVMITCLHRFATLLKELIEDPNDKGDKMDQQEKELGFLVMEALALLLSHNQKNAKVFREHGGARLAHNLVPYRVCRIAALTVVLHLVLCTGGEDDMGTLLGLIHTSKLEELELKSVVLRGLLYILRESHRTRTVFRKVAGFVYIVSLLISMEGCLAVPAKYPWTTVSRHEILAIIRLILNTLTVAMRFEPGNARLFENEVRWESLCDAVKLLGCFSDPYHDDTSSQKIDYAAKHNYDIFENLFYSLDERSLTSINNNTNNEIIPIELINACQIIRYFHDIALDCIDSCVKFGDDFTSDSIHESLVNNQISKVDTFKRLSSTTDEPPNSPLFKYTSAHHQTPLTTSSSSSSSSPNIMLSGGTIVATNNNPTFTFPLYMDEPLIVYPGAVVCILQMLPCIPKQENSHEQLHNRLKYFIMLTIRNLLKHDRNLQIMATHGFAQHLLTICEKALENETNYLHSPVQYIFERLAAFILPAKTLRQFLRLGVDTYTENSEMSSSTSKDKSLIPLNRIKCLVSMTTLRDTRVQISTSSTLSTCMPAFVEFNMGIEGFGALLLPTITPQYISSSSSVVSNFGVVTMTSDSALQGGITLNSGGERSFPPQYGMSYSTWIYIDKFGPIKDNIHPIRLLSIIRHTYNKEDYHFILQIYLHPRDKSLSVSTQEHPFQDCHNDSVSTDEIKSDGLVKFICSEMMADQRWTYMTLVWTKGMLKNSAVTLYINGKQIATQKLHYINNISPSPGNSISTFAYIGSLPVQRVHSSVVWRQGPCFLIEEILSPQTIAAMSGAGPQYIGCFQSVCTDQSNDVFAPLFAEEKIIFSLHPASSFETTLSKFKKTYNKNDAKLVAKQLNMPTSENTVPIRILHNVAALYPGPARSIGGVVIGYLGVRIFVPNSVSKTIEHIGGPYVILGLVASSHDIESFYASIKAFVCVLKSNKQMHNELLRTRGYQILGLLYLKKRHLLNSHILHLTCTLAGTIDTTRESTSVTNPAAFECLLCEFEVWKGASSEIQKSLFEHLLDVFSTTDQQNIVVNQRLTQKIGLVSRLLHLLKEGMSTLHESTRAIVINLIRVLLITYKNTADFIRFGQFLVYLLPSSSVSEKTILANTDLQPSSKINDDSSVSLHHINLRNSLLEMLAKTISEEKYYLTDEFLNCLGYEWLLLFLQSNLHSKTIILATKLLTAFLLSSPNALNRFRDNCMVITSGSSTTTNPPTSLSTPTQTTSPSLISENWTQTINEKSHFKPMFGVGGDINDMKSLTNSTMIIPGFVFLQYLYAQRYEIIPLYYQLTSLLFRQIPEDEVMDYSELKIDKLLKTVTVHIPLTSSTSAPNQTANKQQQQQPQFELDTCPVLLSMTRSLAMQNDEQSEMNGLAIIKFLHQLYQRKTDFYNYSQTVEYLTPLCNIIFPTQSQLQQSNEPATFSLSTTIRGSIVEVLRDIIIDSLYSTNTRIPNVIDYFILSLPDTINDKLYQTFVHSVFKSVMDCMETSEVCSLTMSDDTSSLNSMGMRTLTTTQSPVTHRQPFHTPKTTYARTFSSAFTSSTSSASSSYKALVENVAHFIERMVDKLWESSYYREAKQIFEFIIRIVNQSKKRGSNIHIDSIFRSLNRTILFELSRKMDSISDQMVALDALHRIANYRQLIFSDTNQDSEFFGCLCYCLIVLLDETGLKQNGGDLNSRTIWYHPLDSPTGVSSSSLLNPHPGRDLILNAAQRIWQELYMKKKPALEEVLKISFSQLVNQNKTTLNEVSEYLFDPSSRVWSSFIEGEKRLSDKIQQQIMHVSSRIQRVVGLTGGLRSSLSNVVQLRGSKVKREQIKLDYQTIHNILALMSVNVSTVKENVEIEYRRLAQNIEQKYSYLYEEWDSIEKDLLRERGLWGSDEPNRLDKWKLDFTEGPCRMRKRMILNEEFYKHYPYRIEIDNMSQKPGRKFNPPVSFDSKEYYLRQINSKQHLLLTNTQQQKQQVQQQSFEITSQTPKETTIDSSRLEISPNEIDLWVDKNKQDIVVSSLLATTTKRKANSETAVVPSTDDEDDALLENLEQDEVDTDVQQTPTSTSETVEIEPNNQSVLRLLEDDEKIVLTFRCARIEGLDSTEGILIFGREYFYILEGFTYNIDKNEITDLETIKNEYEPLIPKSSSTAIENIYQKECSKFAYEDIKEVHKRRYLLQPIALELFSADGRNYLLVFQRKERNKVYQRLLNSATELTDSAQHSVSGQRRSINIEQGTSFIGTLMGERSVTQRWERGEISNFQYLMYLNTLAVFPWILADYDSKELNLSNPSTFRDLSKPMGAQTTDRLVQFQKRYVEWDDPTEPFTQVFLRLQGGHFDLADRMFHSIRDTWLSASKNNMADVKELIPEFFYLPDFLLNINKFDLGKKQNGLILNDVLLPTWAKGDAREFIRIHRMALESDYVSSHINEWIDLIFGYKQQGQAAVDATNAFHHLFYEGAVDIDNIEDPLERSAIVGFINNFGQIPKQLFKRPHPQKKLNRALMDSVGTDRSLFFNHVDNLRPSKVAIKELRSAVGTIIASEKTVIAVEQFKALIPPNYTRCISWNYPDESLRVQSLDTDKVLNIWEMGKGRHKRLHLKTRLYGHTDTVTCLTASQAFRILISGSEDQTCIIWDLNRLNFVRQLHNHAGPVSCICVNELTGDIASAASSFLYVWSINGDLLASINTMAFSRNQSILCLAMSQLNEWDNENVIITGSSDGVVRMWSIGYDQVAEDHHDSQSSIINVSEPRNRQASISFPNTQQKSIDSDADSDDGDISTATTANNNITRMPLRSTSDDEENIDENSFHPQSPNTISNPDNSDNFILVTEKEINEADNVKPIIVANVKTKPDLDLKEGYKWERHLIFRSKLTMHTAFERKENMNPAPVTAIGISNWIVNDNPGRTQADHWVKDETFDSCKGCSIRFSFQQRKHHCRNCGQLFCARCSRYETEIPRMKIYKPVRVCKQCYMFIKPKDDYRIHN